MLVVSRFISETVHIGKAGDVLTEPIVITAVDARRIGKSDKQLRIGVDAQRDIGVFRSEIIDAVEMGQNAAKADQIEPRIVPLTTEHAYPCHQHGCQDCGKCADQLIADAGL